MIAYLHSLIHGFSHWLRVGQEVYAGVRETKRIEQSKILVDVIGNEGDKRRHSDAKDGEDFKNNRENDNLGFMSVFALASVAAHSQMPVGEVIHESKQTGHHGVQAIGRHFLADEGEKTGHGRLDPLVEQVLRLHVAVGYG